MTDAIDQPTGGPPRKRGEAAWKAQREDIAERNARARKRGKQEREARELDLTKRRRATERRHDSALPHEFGRR